MPHQLYHGICLAARESRCQLISVRVTMFSFSGIVLSRVKLCAVHQPCIAGGETACSTRNKASPVTAAGGACQLARGVRPPFSSNMLQHCSHAVVAATVVGQRKRWPKDRLAAL